MSDGRTFVGLAGEENIILQEGHHKMIETRRNMTGDILVDKVIGLDKYAKLLLSSFGYQ